MTLRGYKVTLERDDEGDIIARIPVLRGCVAHGKDSAQALSRLSSVLALWVADCAEVGQEMPRPR